MRARSCLIWLCMRCWTLTIMGGCGVSESAVKERSPRPRRHSRAANWRANGGGEARQRHATGTFRSYGSAWYARPSPCLLCRGPLGVRRWAGRPSRHSLVRKPRTSPGPGRIGTAHDRVARGRVESSEARAEPPSRVPRERPDEAPSGRAADRRCRDL